MFTRPRRARPGAGASQTAGVDFRLATSRFRGNQNLNLLGLVPPRQPAGRHHAAQRLRRRRRLSQRPLVSAASTPARCRRNFDPSVGFVTRRDYRRYNQFVGFGPRPRNSRVVRRVQFNGGLEIFTDLRNNLLERNVNADAAQHAVPEPGPVRRGGLAQLRAARRAVPHQPGHHAADGRRVHLPRVAVAGQTANRRMLALNGRFETGGFYSGTRRQTIAGLTVRARPGYIFSFNGEWNHGGPGRGARSRRTCSA